MIRTPQGIQRKVAIVGAAAVALGLVGGIAVWQLDRDGGSVSAQQPAASATVPAPSPVLSTVTVAVPSSQPSAPSPSATEPVPTTKPVDPEAEARRLLKAMADQGLDQHQLDSRWVAQMASKWIGIKDDLQVTASGSHKFRAADIVSEHQRLYRGTTDGSDVFMLRSSDFGVGYRYKGKVLWITFADGGFTSRADVKRWCRLRFPELSGEKLVNQCLPNRLRPIEKR